MFHVDKLESLGIYDVMGIIIKPRNKLHRTE